MSGSGMIGRQSTADDSQQPVAGTLVLARITGKVEMDICCNKTVTWLCFLAAWTGAFNAPIRQYWHECCRCCCCWPGVALSKMYMLYGSR